MTQEEKELLLKDLYARLLYSTRIHITHPSNNHIELDDWLTIGTIDNLSWFGSVKPYLRPMSSMTEEERQEYFVLSHRDNDIEDNRIMTDEAIMLIDWLNAHHFDFHELINKGLALEAPEGMYKF